MSKLRLPFFLAAMLLIAVVIFTATGNQEVLNRLRSVLNIAADVQLPISDLLPQDGELRRIYNEKTADVDKLADEADDIPGFSVPYMALSDGLLLLTLVLIALSLPKKIPPKWQGCLGGCATILFCIPLIIGSIVLVYLTLARIIIMVALLFAFPFGTIIYFIRYASFDRSGVNLILSLAMSLKIAVAACLVAAQQKFLLNIGLVLMIATSLILTLVLTFLINLPPGFLVSITDAIGGIVGAIVAIIWSILLIIGAVIAIFMSLKGFVS